MNKLIFNTEFTDAQQQEATQRVADVMKTLDKMCGEYITGTGEDAKSQAQLMYLTANGLNPALVCGVSHIMNEMAHEIVRHQFEKLGPAAIADVPNMMLWPIAMGFLLGHRIGREAFDALSG